MRKNEELVDECWTALAMIRRTIEDHCPPGVLPEDEMVYGLYAPTMMGEAEAISRAIVATVAKLQVQGTLKPPAPNIKA
ncbi:hypothetical protein LB531_21240 [Mesorhizobium sp. CO1-1-2]|uniref:hypothetical protein n=1 Tax=Mesorhizobium sp. CO1-1-2 TaxID=2876635 RepID=UPI001CCD9041|nr:hypothetical protein [Mesorhizobium sp. CO1-1-2]MBZ9683186.1 hypothetical protein [Mesorhizobium sp. CO1-1-2]